MSEHQVSAIYEYQVFYDTSREGPASLSVEPFFGGLGRFLRFLGVGRPAQASAYAILQVSHWRL